MFRPIDWPMFGLKAAQLGAHARAHPVPTGGAAQPFREMGELYPAWAAQGREALTLGLACSLNWGTARRLVGDFRRTHPEIELIIEDGDELALAEGLKTKRIDLAIAPDGAHRRGWRALPLWRERLIAVMPEGHRLGAANEVRSEDLRDEPILLTGDGAGDPALRRAIGQALGGHAVFEHRLVQRDTLFDLVGMGFGVTITAGAALGAFHPGVCLRPICGPVSDIGFSLFWEDGNDKTALQTFVTAAQRVA